ncbi:hypothetical protein AAW14_24820 [Streptomyces hygroscopicus]|nr:hypothetical protein [Streptomyces hygroscopicus]
MKIGGGVRIAFVWGIRTYADNYLRDYNLLDLDYLFPRSSSRIFALKSATSATDEDVFVFGYQLNVEATWHARENFCK